MKLSRIITVNWGNLESREWDMADMTLLVGESGSGKTTLLDAIQTVLTATRGGVFFYNPGQEEATQGSRTKEKRTLADYCLGREGESFARDSAHTYLAAVFEPSADEEGMPITAVIAAEALTASRKAELQKLGLYVLRRRALNWGHFEAPATDNQRGLSVIEVREFYAHLQRSIGREAVEYFGDDKGLFLRHLYGAFRGQKHVDEQEAIRAARALVKAIAYKPAGSIDTLVRDELLEEDDISEDLKKVGELLRDIRNLSEEARRLSESITRLKTAKKEGEEVLNAVAEVHAYDLARALRIVARSQDELVRKGNDITAADAEAKRLRSLVEVGEGTLHQLMSSQNSLLAQLEKIPAWNQKETLERKVDEAERRAVEAIAETATWLDALAKLVDEAAAIERLPADGLPPPLALARDAVVATLGPVRRLSARRLATVLEKIPQNDFSPRTAAEAADHVGELTKPAETLVEALLRGESNFVKALDQQQALGAQEMQQVLDEEERLTTTLKRLSEGRTALPDNVQLGYDRLRHEMPQAKAQMLCELVEPKGDTPWQNAIEGYLGNDRYAIIVETDFEGQAADYSRHKLDYRNRLKIVQGRKALRDNRTPPPNSILEELNVSHETALAFLRARYGDVLKVADTKTLTSMSRGLTQEGVGAGGFGMYPAFAKDEELVLGVAARRRRQAAAERQLEGVRARKRALESDLRNQRELANRLRRLALTGNPGAAMTVFELCQGRTDAREALARLDLCETETLQAELDNVLDQMKAVRKSNAAHGLEALHRESDASQARARVKELGDALPSQQAEVANIRGRFSLLEQSSDHRLRATELDARATALFDDRATTDNSLTSKHSSLLHELPTRNADFLNALGDYQLRARDVERVVFDRERLRSTEPAAYVTSLCVTLLDIDEQLAKQERFGLAENMQRLQKAEKDFHHVFTSDFCFRIRSKVQKGTEPLRELNKQLEHLVFGGDRFVIEWDWWPEYQDYYRFFEAVFSRADELGQKSIFDEGVLPPDLAKVRDDLRSLLLTSDEETAQKRLKEVADYRKYRRYEIYRQTATGDRMPLSKWGTGSGGQLETPFYVVRSAVLSSALGFFEKGDTKLRLMLSDEAFAKMDESRRRSVIRYLREKLGVQLIVAMPTANAASVKPEFEKEFTFARVSATLADGRDWFAFEAQEKALKRDALQSRWDVAEIEARVGARAEFEKRYPGVLAAEEGLAKAGSGTAAHQVPAAEVNALSARSSESVASERDG
jgi:energy-coupling factor transporter ATP-binding protein EcfA2